MTFWGSRCGMEALLMPANRVLAARQSVMIYHARRLDTTIQQIPRRQKLQASAIGGGVAGLSTASLFREYLLTCRPSQS